MTERNRTIEAEIVAYGVVKTARRIAELNSLYTAVNHMMARLGADGEISTRHEAVEAVMGALHRIDGGVPKEQENDDAGQ